MFCSETYVSLSFYFHASSLFSFAFSSNRQYAFQVRFQHLLLLCHITLFSHFCRDQRDWQELQ
jgi:hypothetical protein